MAVTPAMIATAMGRTAPVDGSLDHEQWEMWIADAAMLIQARIDALNPDSLPDSIKVDYVIREAVVAHIRRPDAATQVTVTANDASVSKTYQKAQGRVVILDEWWVLLGLQAKGGAYAVDTAGSVGLAGHAPWCDLWFGGLNATCSCGYDLAGFPLFSGFNYDDDC